MRLYRQNRIDQPFDMTAEAIAAEFWARWTPEQLANHGWPLDRALRWFLTTEAGGTGGAWDPDDPRDHADYRLAFEAVRAAWPES